MRREEARLAGNEAVFLPLEPPPSLIQEGGERLSQQNPPHSPTWGPATPSAPHCYQAGKHRKNSGRDAIRWEAVKASSQARAKHGQSQNCFFPEAALGWVGARAGAEGN